MLEEIIKDLRMTNSDDHIVRGGALGWAKKSRGTKGADSSVKYTNRVEKI